LIYFESFTGVYKSAISNRSTSFKYKLFVIIFTYFNVELIAVISELIQGKTEFIATLTYRFSDGECDDDIEKDNTIAYARIKQALFIKVSFITHARMHTQVGKPKSTSITASFLYYKLYKYMFHAKS